MRRLFIAVVIGGLSAAGLAAERLQTAGITTEITKWPDGKQAALALTYDDSTINQFRVALPMMNERGLPGTFFVITGEIPGSRFPPMFNGRPIMDILRESATVPTGWAEAEIRQGGAIQTAAVRREGERSFVQYRIVPDGTVARLARRP